MEPCVQERAHHHHHRPLLLPGTDHPVGRGLPPTPLEGHGAGPHESAGALRGVCFLVSSPPPRCHITHRQILHPRSGGWLTLWVNNRYLPESARWLLTQGRREEARKQLQRAARVNGRSLPEDALDKVAPGGGVGGAHTNTFPHVPRLLSSAVPATAFMTLICPLPPPPAGNNGGEEEEPAGRLPDSVPEEPQPRHGVYLVCAPLTQNQHGWEV